MTVPIRTLQYLLVKITDNMSADNIFQDVLTGQSNKFILQWKEINSNFQHQVTLIVSLELIKYNHSYNNTFVLGHCIYTYIYLLYIYF